MLVRPRQFSREQLPDNDAKAVYVAGVCVFVGLEDLISTSVRGVRNKRLGYGQNLAHRCRLPEMTAKISKDSASPVRCNQMIKLTEKRVRGITIQVVCKISESNPSTNASPSKQNAVQLCLAPKLPPYEIVSGFCDALTSGAVQATLIWVWLVYVARAVVCVLRANRELPKSPICTIRTRNRSRKADVIIGIQWSATLRPRGRLKEV